MKKSILILSFFSISAIGAMAQTNKITAKPNKDSAAHAEGGKADVYRMEKIISDGTTFVKQKPDGTLTKSKKKLKRKHCNKK